MRQYFNNSRNRQKVPAPKPKKSVSEMNDKEQDKYDNELVSAYIYTHKNGRRIQVSCPRRLVKVVQKEAKYDLLQGLELNPNV